MSALLAGRPVAGAAAGTVRAAWVTRATGRHRMFPGAGAAIAVTSDGTARVYGPQTRAWWVDAPGDVGAVGVDVRPGALVGRLSGDVSELVGVEADLDDLLPRAERGRVVDAVLTHADEASRVRAVQRETVRLLGAPDRRIVGVGRTLWSDPAITVRDLARGASLSERQLNRLCTRSFGMGPAMLRRLVRLERFAMLADRAPTTLAPTTLAAMATTAGYFDQQHLARDCRMLVDRTPAELLHSC